MNKLVTSMIWYFIWCCIGGINAGQVLKGLMEDGSIAWLHVAGVVGSWYLGRDELRRLGSQGRES